MTTPETLNYDYNIRGWMLGMNRDYARDVSSTNWFGLDFGYDKTNKNIIGNQTYANPQYNGNIEGMVWKSKGDGEKRKYDFYYDTFSTTIKKINKIIGDGKRFIAYEIINRLEEARKTDVLAVPEKAVEAKRKDKGKKHEVWEEPFDWKLCETTAFAYQKLLYMHNNSCAGKWRLVDDITKYEHSPARFYITGKHAGYDVTDMEEILAGRQLSGPAVRLRAGTGLMVSCKLTITPDPKFQASDNI